VTEARNARLPVHLHSVLINLDTEAFCLSFAAGPELGKQGEQLVPSRGDNEPADAMRREIVMLAAQPHVLQDLNEAWQPAGSDRFNSMMTRRPSLPLAKMSM
jgi:hypothetical protein